MVVFSDGYVSCHHKVIIIVYYDTLFWYTSLEIVVVFSIRNVGWHAWRSWYNHTPPVGASEILCRMYCLLHVHCYLTTCWCDKRRPYCWYPLELWPLLVQLNELTSRTGHANVVKFKWKVMTNKTPLIIGRILATLVLYTVLILILPPIGAVDALIS